MNRYDIERKLDFLYLELDEAMDSDEQTVCLMHSVDDKRDAIALIEDEIRYCKAMLDELDEAADDGMDYIGLQISQGLPVFLPGRM